MIEVKDEHVSMTIMFISMAVAAVWSLLSDLLLQWSWEAWLVVANVVAALISVQVAAWHEAGERAPRARLLYWATLALVGAASMYVWMQFSWPTLFAAFLVAGLVSRAYVARSSGLTFWSLGTGAKFSARRYLNRLRTIQKDFERAVQEEFAESSRNPDVIRGVHALNRAVANLEQVMSSASKNASSNSAEKLGASSSDHEDDEENADDW